jgi:cation transport ATPase
VGTMAKVTNVEKSEVKNAWGSTKGEKKLKVTKTTEEVITIKDPEAIKAEKKKQKEIQKKADAVKKAKKKPVFTYLNLIKFVKVAGTIALVFIAFCQILQLVFGITTQFNMGLGAIIVNALFNIIIIMGIWERPFVQKWFKAFDNWIGLGLAQIAIGFVTAASNDGFLLVLDTDGLVPVAVLSYVYYVIYLTFVSGTVYFILGAFFGGKGKKDDKEKQKLKEDKEREGKVKKAEAEHRAVKKKHGV